MWLIPYWLTWLVDTYEGLDDNVRWLTSVAGTRLESVILAFVSHCHLVISILPFALSNRACTAICVCPLLFGLTVFTVYLKLPFYIGFLYLCQVRNLRLTCVSALLIFIYFYCILHLIILCSSQLERWFPWCFWCQDWFKISVLHFCGHR